MAAVGSEDFEVFGGVFSHLGKIKNAIFIIAYFI